MAFKIASISAVRGAIGGMVLAALILLSLACSPTFDDLDNLPSAGKLARAMIDEYIQNPIRFERDRVGERMQFHGKVNTIGKRGIIVFRGGGGVLVGKSLSCRFPDKYTLADLSRGSKITATGVIDSVGGSQDSGRLFLMVRDCRLVGKR